MLLSKIKLSMRFGRVTYVVSSVLSLVMTVFAVLSPQVIPLCIIIKLLSIPVIQYLVTNLSEGLVMYFYINLGISKKEYCLIPAAVDFGIFVLLMSDAEFCILDEPFSNVAPNCIDKIQALILEQKSRKGIIVSDHMYEQIIGISDDLYLLRDGYTFPIKCREDLIDNGYIRR